MNVFTKEQYDRESARLGAIIDCHIDDSAWLLGLLGLAAAKDEHYQFRLVGCLLDRPKITEKLAKRSDQPDYTALLAQNAKLLAALDAIDGYIAKYPHDMGLESFAKGEIAAAKAGA